MDLPGVRINLAQGSVRIRAGQVGVVAFHAGRVAVNVGIISVLFFRVFLLGLFHFAKLVGRDGGCQDRVRPRCARSCCNPGRPLSTRFDKSPVRPCRRRAPLRGRRQPPQIRLLHPRLEDRRRRLRHRRASAAAAGAASSESRAAAAACEPTGTASSSCEPAAAAATAASTTTSSASTAAGPTTTIPNHMMQARVARSRDRANRGAADVNDFQRHFPRLFRQRVVNLRARRRVLGDETPERGAAARLAPPPHHRRRFIEGRPVRQIVRLNLTQGADVQRPKTAAVRGRHDFAVHGVEGEFKDRHGGKIGPELVPGTGRGPARTTRRIRFRARADSGSGCLPARRGTSRPANWRGWISRSCQNPR